MKICFGDYLPNIENPDFFVNAISKKAASEIQRLSGEDVDFRVFSVRDEMTAALAEGGYDLIVTKCKLKMSDAGEGSDSVGLGTVKKWLTNGYAKRVILIFDKDMQPKLGDVDGKTNWLISGRKTVEFWKKEYYDGLYVTDYQPDKVLELFRNGRSAEEAKAYYGITDEMISTRPEKKVVENIEEVKVESFTEEVKTESVSEPVNVIDEVIIEETKKETEGVSSYYNSEPDFDTETVIDIPVMEEQLTEEDNDFDGIFKESASDNTERSSSDSNDVFTDAYGLVAELLGNDLKDMVDDVSSYNKEETKYTEKVEAEIVDTPPKFTTIEGGGRDSVEFMGRYARRETLLTFDEMFEIDEAQFKNRTPAGNGFVFDTDIDLLDENAEVFGVSDKVLETLNATKDHFPTRQEEFREYVQKSNEQMEAEEFEMGEEVEAVQKQYGPMFDMYIDENKREQIKQFREEVMDARESGAKFRPESNEGLNVINITAPAARKQFTEPIDGMVDKLVGRTTLMIETTGSLLELELTEYAVHGIIDTGVAGRIENGKRKSGVIKIEGFGLSWLSATNLLIEITNINLMDNKEMILKKPCSLMFTKIEEG